MHKQILLLVPLAIMTGTGCASKRDWTLVGKPENYQYRETKNKITVAAEAWTKSEDLKNVFDKNLCEKNILPIRLVIFNYSNQTVRFSSTQAKLRLPKGQLISVLPDSEVSKRVEVNEAGAAGVITILTLGYGAPLAAASAQGNAKKNWKAKNAVRKCSMSLVTLDPEEALAGFVFYDCSLRKLCRENLDPKVDLVIERMPCSVGNPLGFSIPLYVLSKE